MLRHPETLTLFQGFALSGSRFAPSPIGRVGVLALAGLLTTVAGCMHSAPGVILDHDGGIDDLIAISLLIKSG
jgi:hypothetical protein